MKKLFQKLFFTGFVIAGTIGAVSAQTANVQIIHNCPDPAADTVDIYVINGADTVPLRGVAFRTATAFLAVPAGVTYTVAVSAPHSTSAAGALYTQQVGPLTAGVNYEVIASGEVDTVGFAANPSGLSRAFTLWIKSNAEIHGSHVSDTTDLLVVHGSPDAPAVNVYVEQAAADIVTDASYGAITSYIDVPSATYNLDVQSYPSAATVARYTAPLGAFPDSSLVVLASGFLTPSANKNGPAFGLWVALASGGNLVPLTNSTGIKNISSEIGLKYYPNPASGTLHVSFDANSSPAINILDLNGNVLKTVNAGNENSVSINTADLNEGLYILHVVTAAGAANEKFAVIK